MNKWKSDRDLEIKIDDDRFKQLAKKLFMAGVFLFLLSELLWFAFFVN